MSSPIDIAATLTSRMYCVVVKHPSNGKLTLVMDPGLNAPWRGQGLFGKRRGDQIAKEFNGMCCTWAEAWSLLVKDYPGGLKALEDELMKKIADGQVKQANPKL